MIMLFTLSFQLWSQPFQNTATSQNGFQLELSAMNPIGVGGVMTGPLKTGLIYNYLIKYVIPSGTTTPVVITLNAPIGVRLYPQSNNQPALTGGVMATSAINYTTNAVTVTINPPSPNLNGISETIQVYAWMPPNSTCNGTVFNSSCTLSNTSTQLVTGNVAVTAEATSDWCIKEELAQIHHPLLAIAQGGTANYVHRVFRNVQHPEQDTIGKMSIQRLDLKSTAPPNAVIVPISGANYLAGNMFINPVNLVSNSLIWSTKPLSLVPPIYGYNDNSLINYPSSFFLGGATPTNTLTATAVRYGGCATDTQMDVACQQSSVNVGIIASGTNSAVSNKTHIPFGNIVPRCEYRYRMGFRNTGSTPINTFTIEDDLPPVFTPTGIIGLYYPYNISGTNFTINVNGLPVGFTFSGSMPYYIVTLNSGTFNTGDVLAFMANNIPSTIDLETNQSCYIDVLGSHNATTCFSNTANVIIPNINQLTATDQVCPATPNTQICYRKEVLNPNNLPTIYQRGNTVKYRIRVKNIGNNTFTPTMIDELGAGLEYDNSILQATLFHSVPNTVGPPTITNQGVLNPVYNFGNNTLTFTFPSLSGVCATVNNTTCDSNYVNKKHYFIEFNVKVAANSPAGDIPNLIYEATTPSVKNIAFISVGHAYGINVVKRIRKKGTTTWLSSLDTQVGTAVEFQLDFHNSSTVALNDLLLIDLLPRVTDRAVLNGNTRSSAFSLIAPSSFSATKRIGSTIPIPFSIPSGALKFNTEPNPKLTDFGQTSGTAVSFSSFLTLSTNNIRLELTGGNVLQPDEHLLLQFETTIPSATPVDKIACNSFAAKGTTFNGTGVGINILPVESNTVCVKVIPVPDTCTCKDIKFQFSNDVSKPCEDIVSFKTSCKKIRKIEILSTGNSVQFVTVPNNCIPFSNSSTHVDFGISGCATAIYQFNVFSNNGIQPYSVVITLMNGTTCLYNDKIGCDTTSFCCDKTQIVKSKDCCSKLSIEKCKVKSIDIQVFNGIIDGLDFGSGTCTDPIPNGTNHQILTTCDQPNSLTTCVKNKSPQNYVYITYSIVYEDNSKCQKKDTVYCPPPPIGNGCCPKTTMVACCISTNQIQYEFNAVSVPTNVCSMVVNVSSTSGLVPGNAYSSGLVASPIVLNGQTMFLPIVTLGQSLTYYITTPIQNPTVNVTIQYVLCDGTKCDAETFTLGSPSVKNGNNLISQTILDSLFASTYKLDFKGVKDSKLKVKSISLLPQGTNAKDVFFAITGSSVLGSENKLLLSLDKSLQGNSFATFVLKKAVSVSEYNGEVLNIVTRGRVKSFKIFMFDEKGGLISEGTVTSQLQAVTSSTELKSNFINFSIAPNPAAENVNISYELTKNEQVKIELFDATGKAVEKIEEGFKAANQVHNTTFNIGHLPSGLYIIRMTNGKGNILTEKLTVVH